MKITKYLALLGVVVAAGSISRQADASTISATWKSIVNGVSNVEYSTDSGSNWSRVGGTGGLFAFQLDSGSFGAELDAALVDQTNRQFAAICIDPAQHVPTNGASVTYTLGALTDASAPGPAEFTAAEAAFIGRVLGAAFQPGFTYSGGGGSDQATAIGALELLLWEAFWGDDTGVGPASGVIQVKGGPTGSVALAMDWVSAYGAGSDSPVNTIALLSDGTQDFLVFGTKTGGGDTVPAPAPFALLGLGLVGMFSARRLRRA